MNSVPFRSDTAIQPPQPMQPISGPAVWTGAELAQSEEWIHNLTTLEADELEGAARETERAGLPIMEIGRDDFVLPRLGPVLAAIQSDIVEGRGFVLIRGVPIEGRQREIAARMYWGIGAHLGDAVSQNGKGHLLGHIKDLGRPEGPSTRPYQTTIGLAYHTDSCDIVGLMCLARAKAGGLSSIASAGAVYNALLARRPDLAEALSGTFYCDRRTEVPEGKLPYYTVSIFNFHDATMTSVGMRHDIESAQRFADVPRLTDVQREALVAMEATAEELSLKMDFRPGDIQFLHNHTVYHSRTAFEDYPEPERKRHLLRLWLSVPAGRPLPPFLAERWGSIEPGSVRGGIIVPGASLNAPLHAR
jgi:hypothetical protein